MVSISTLGKAEKFLNGDDEANVRALERGEDPVMRRPAGNDGAMPNYMDAAGEYFNNLVDNPARIGSYALPLLGPAGLIASPLAEAAADQHDGHKSLQSVINNSPRLQKFIRFMADVPKGRHVTAEDAMVAFADFPDIAAKLDPSEDTLLRGGAQAGMALATGGASLPVSIGLGLATDGAICEAAGINSDDQQKVLAMLEWIGNNPKLDMVKALDRLNDMVVLGELPEIDDIPAIQRPQPRRMAQAGNRMPYGGHPSGLPPQMNDSRLAQARRAGYNPSPC